MVILKVVKHEYIKRASKMADSVTPNPLTIILAVLRLIIKHSVAYKNLPPSSGYAGNKFTIAIDAFAKTISSVYGYISGTNHQSATHNSAITPFVIGPANAILHSSI